MKNSYLDIFKKTMFSAWVFFFCILGFSVGYSAFVGGYPSSVTSSSMLSSTEWNKMAAALQSLDSVFAISGANVGIGNPSPTQKLSVSGMIESNSGGFKFPDGSIQTKASYFKTSSATASTTIPTNWADSGLSFVATVDGKQSVLLMSNIEFTSSVSGRGLAMRFMRDSTQVGSYTPQDVSEMSWAPDTIAFSTHDVDILPPAGTYTYKIQWYAPSSTTTAYGRRLTGLIASDQ